jgi:hypothetical protein
MGRKHKGKGQKEELKEEFQRQRGSVNKLGRQRLQAAGGDPERYHQQKALWKQDLPLRQGDYIHSYPRHREESNLRDGLLVFRKLDSD